MELLDEKVIRLLNFLLPGFLAAWVFYGLTPHPKKDAFERTIQALIFTIVIRGLFLAVKQNWSSVWGWFGHPAAWTTDNWWEEGKEGKELFFTLLLAVAVGFIVATFANCDWPHRWLRKIKVTKRTAYPSEWYSCFHRFNRDVILHLKDGRRLMGYVEEFPDQSDKGHFLLQSPAWLDETASQFPLLQIIRFIVPVSGVEFVELMCDEDELPMPIKDIRKKQKKWIEMHKKNKEPNDGEENGSPTTAESERPVAEPAEGNGAENG